MSKAKDSVLKLSKLVPPIKRYLAEKEQMQVTILHQEMVNKALNNEIKYLRGSNNNQRDVMPRLFESALLAAKIINQSNVKAKTPPFTINWIIPPMQAGSGGHTDIFRTAAFLQLKGHNNRLIFYDPIETYSLYKIKQALNHYPFVGAPVYYNPSKLETADITFATHWTTAYYTAALKDKSRKYYYVQDYEPFFEPAGANRVFAENSYRLNLRGITLGRWLTQILSTTYNMRCDYFNFGYNPAEYKFDNNKQRQDVLSYIRPSTPRRGFELCVLALKIFSQTLPKS